MATRKSLGEVREYYGKILPFYELESVARRDLGFWRSLVRHGRPARVLDVGAGLGRITNAVAHDAPTIGIDISLEMLARARRRLEPARSRFVAADMRRVAFAGGFDLIIAASDPFSHLTSETERRQALRAVAEQLSGHGHFVLEGLYRRRREIFEPPERRIRHADGVLSISESWRPIGTRQLWNARYLYRDRRDDGDETTVEASFVARAWDPAEIRRSFASCGLTIEEIWGDFDRRPFSRDATRLVVVARRSARRTVRPK